jgi:hypothetical protein
MTGGTPSRRPVLPASRADIGCHTSAVMTTKISAGGDKLTANFTATPTLDVVRLRASRDAQAMRTEMTGSYWVIYAGTRTPDVAKILVVTSQPAS